jgi:acyl-CoA thioesterase-1
MSMKNFWIFPLAAIVACQSERNMNGGDAERRTDSATNVVTASPDSAAGKLTVLFFGTSLTAGYGLEPSQAFPVLVAQKAAAEGYPINAINAGLSGETSAGALRRIDWVMKKPVDIVVVETGGNDGLRALDAAALKSNLIGIVKKIRAAQPRAKIVLAMMEAPPNFGAKYTAGFREAYTSVSKSEKVGLMPFLLDSVAGKAELNQDDAVHPNVAGERIVANNVWRALKPVVVEAQSATAISR